MCGRFSLGDGAVLADVTDRAHRLGAEDVKLEGEVRPSETALVIANNRRGTPSVFAMEWGYTLPDGKRIINARSETASWKPMFRDGFAQRRCLIPADHYFEWQARQKFALQPKNGGRFYLAGIYRMEQGKPVFCILTRAAAAEIEFLHERMPVMLPESAKSRWLDLCCNAEDVLADALTEMDFRMV